MGSRKLDGSRIIQTENLQSIRHNGGHLPVTTSDDDTVTERLDNTSVRPGG